MFRDEDYGGDADDALDPGTGGEYYPASGRRQQQRRPQHAEAAVPPLPDSARGYTPPRQFAPPQQFAPQTPYGEDSTSSFSREYSDPQRSGGRPYESPSTRGYPRNGGGRPYDESPVRSGNYGGGVGSSRGTPSRSYHRPRDWDEQPHHQQEYDDYHLRLEQPAAQHYQQQQHQQPIQQQQQQQQFDHRTSPGTIDAATSSSGEYVDYSSPQYNDNQMGIAEGMGAGRPVLPSSAAVPEEVLAVRAAALTVLTPLTLAWPIVSAGFATTVGLGLARYTDVWEDAPFWAILLPSWLSHLALLGCHVASAQALSAFIASANDSRQRDESTDHLDRTEYLPLLQRSLKFGVKTGLLSLCAFAFEVLAYVHVAKGSLTLAAAMTPLWVVVGGAVLDGVVCKTQHVLRVLCWSLLLASMVLLVLRVDHNVEALRWRIVVAPLIAFLSVSSASLIYVVYGHQVGYYHLSESQLTAGILYSLAALLCIILVVLMGDFVPYLASDDIDMRLFVVGLGPLVVLLVGMGAWAVSRDERDRLLRHGGQAAVHPMCLRLELEGWTATEGRGVAVLPMFGEVRYEPLDGSRSLTRCGGIELCPCCACYPQEEDDNVAYREAPSPSQVQASRSLRGGHYNPALAGSSQHSVRTGEAAIPPRGSQV